MGVKRKSHNLDETLLRRAKRVLGASTETQAIHDALRAVLISADMVADLDAARGLAHEGGQRRLRAGSGSVRSART